MAPEVMRHERYGTPADVWSFGVMLGELITLDAPYRHSALKPAQARPGRGAGGPAGCSNACGCPRA
jgi:serine/threonine protein kinase